MPAFQNCKDKPMLSSLCSSRREQEPQVETIQSHDKKNSWGLHVCIPQTHGREVRLLQFNVQRGSAINCNLTCLYDLPWLEREDVTKLLATFQPFLPALRSFEPNSSKFCIRYPTSSYSIGNQYKRRSKWKLAVTSYHQIRKYLLDSR